MRFQAGNQAERAPQWRGVEAPGKEEEEEKDGVHHFECRIESRASSGLTAAALPGGGRETGPLNVFQLGGGWQLENSSHARLKTCQVARPVAERLGDPLTGAPKASLGSECRGWNGMALFQGCWGHRA